MSDINKVIYGDQILMDLTDTTTEAGDVIDGQVFYSKAGTRTVGTLGDATQSTHGLMSTADKVKLDTIETFTKTVSTPTGVASFSDGADGLPLKALKVGIEPVQDLHGYDYPWPAGGGKNLVPMTVENIKSYNDGSSWTGNKYTAFGVEYEILTDEDNNVTGIKATGTASTTYVFWLGPVTIQADTSYTVNSGVTTGDNDVFVRMSGPGKSVYTHQHSSRGSDKSFTETTTEEQWMNIRIGDGCTVDLVFHPYCFLTSYGLTAFAPYSNICHISGWTGAKVWDDPAYGGNIEWNQLANNASPPTSRNEITITHDDYSFTLNGTSSSDVSATGWFDLNENNENYRALAGHKVFVAFNLLSGTYTLPMGGSATFTLLPGHSALICGIGSNIIHVFPQVAGWDTSTRQRIDISSGASFTNARFSLIVCDLTRMFGSTIADYIYGLEAETAGAGVSWFKNLFPKKYYAYDTGRTATVSAVNGDEYRYREITFPSQVGTVYGGTLDVTNGTLTVDRAEVDLGTLSWVHQSSVKEGLFTSADLNLKKAGNYNLVCSQYKTSVVEASSNMMDKTIKGHASTTNVYIYDTLYSDATTFTAAMSGVQLVYELVNPIVYQLTPAEVKTLLGQNTIWADTGNILELTYYFDRPINYELNTPTVTTTSNGLMSFTDKIKLDNISIFGASGSTAASGLVPAPSTTVGTTAFLCEDGTWKVPYSVMTGATSSANGASGLVPAPTSADVDKFLAGDGTYKSGGLPMVILSYGNSTWDDFINAYNNNVIVYCRASSQSNPKNGSQTRMAFMAYVSDATNPTNVEFQYYRSMNPTSKSINQMSDQVFVYKLDKTSGWSVTTREASIKSVVFDASSGLTGTYNNSTGVLTITAAT